MKNKRTQSSKEHYSQLRTLSCEDLWSREVPSFDRASPEERMERVAVVRAVGVAFSESGTAEQKEDVLRWLRGLLYDPAEKIRRYAMTAMPKLNAGTREEMELLALLERTASEREKQSLAETLEKIGGKATLHTLTRKAPDALNPAMQKVTANLAREQTPSAISFTKTLKQFQNASIHLRCRSGLERLMNEELQERTKSDPKFRITHCQQGLLEIRLVAPFKLADVYALRCFDNASFVLGVLDRDSGENIEALASVIAAPASRRLLEAFTDGPIRYRLEFVSKGHQRSAVRALADRVFALCPTLINDSRNAPWEIGIRPAGRDYFVELSPKLRPDPRFSYRKGDVPAASHPPLAACMARLAGFAHEEIAWDPFCGSGLELVERALRGGVQRVIGTDHDETAIQTASVNFDSALKGEVPATFTCCDFRDFASVQGLREGSVSLVITNPPMGRRVPIPNLRGLIDDLFATADAVLRPGGRLVFANPLPVEPKHRSLKPEYRQKIDLGGFHCRLEKYIKLG